MNLLEDFLARAEKLGHRPAIIESGGRTISFAALAARSDAVAAAWRRKGIARGMRVLIAMPLGINLYIGLAALWRLGAVAVFPEPAMGLKGLAHALAVTCPEAFLTGGPYGLLRYALPGLWRVPTVLHVDADATGAAGVVDTLSGEAALISFTSGSTGTPKAIVRSHGFLAAQNAAVAPLLAPKRERETDLVAFPVFVIANLALGVTSLLPNWPLTRHDKAVAGAITAHAARHGAGRALVPPSICETLAEGGTPLPFDAIFTGGGPVYPDLLDRLMRQTPGMAITAVYGSTEAEPIAHIDSREITPADWQAMQSGAGLLAGHPVACVQVKILDDEIVVTGDHVNKGYLDPARDAATKLAIDGAIWHRTGDAGRLDAQGRLWLLGRLDGRAGGHFPFAMECAARAWPGVRRAALVARDGRALIALEGREPSPGLWQARAAALGLEARPLARIPLDRRHASKVDYAALGRLL